MTTAKGECDSKGRFKVVAAIWLMRQTYHNKKAAAEVNRILPPKTALQGYKAVFGRQARFSA